MKARIDKGFAAWILFMGNLCLFIFYLFIWKVEILIYIIII
jgi:hypothetical protein